MSFLFPSATITFDAALRDASAKGVKARLRAVIALGQVDEPTQKRRAAEALTHALTDEEAAVRVEALAGLAGMGELAPLPAIIARLADGDPGVRQHAAIALGRLGDRAGFAPLAESLREGPADLRFQAVTSLAEIDPVAAFEPVRAALDDRDAQVVAAAAVALGALRDGRAVTALVPVLSHPDAAARFEAAWALAQLGDGRGRAELALAVESPDGAAHPGRAMEAAQALGALGDDLDLAALARATSAKQAAPEAQVVAARYVLELLAARDETTAQHQAWGAAARGVLLAALAGRRDPLRGLAIEQLSHVAGRWAEAPLLALRDRRRGRPFAEAITDALAAISARAP